ncbi:winged helix-turn-helix transcriptional regulator [Hugenholtzia roseola]|uniref:winged helix-turn-helix transcriptional regulator n=1 Tax=Hugenholtzia roseola TaxID=1002 RepID=UPI000479C369|nr:helix-turn-helix domain-containing protein [Hugenholtzia roseola]
MPDFSYNGKIYYNPVEFAMDRIGGTWKMPILWRLQNGKVLRYSELKKSLKHVSDKMLASQLRELEADGFVERTVYPVVPPRTEYKLTPKGEKVIPVIIYIRNYGLELMAELGLGS